MRLLPLALLCVSSVASAKTFGGDVVTVRPESASELAGGSLGLWLAGGVGDNAYVGGELSIGNYVTSDDVGISYHALAGFESVLGDHVSLLFDAGAGVTQQIEIRLGILGGNSGSETTAWIPSGAVRAQLVGNLGTIGASTVGLALHTETRVGFPLDGDATAGAGLGLGVVLSR